MFVSLLSGSVIAQDQGPSSEQVLGAIAGGALGSTIGKGDGKKAATVLGAIIGYRNGERILNREDERQYQYRNHGPYTNTYDVQRECRNRVPNIYMDDYDMRRMWISGCVSRMESMIRDRQRHEYEERRRAMDDAYNDGYRQGN